MPFFNSYKNTDKVQYLDATQAGNVVYGVGKIQEVSGSPFFPITGQEQGLVTKVDKEGQLIWEKSYTDSRNTPLDFSKVTACPNGDIIVMSKPRQEFNQIYMSLTRIASNGSVVWHKTSLSASGRFYALNQIRLTSLPDGRFFIMISDQDSTSSSSHKTSVLLMSASGDIIAQAHMGNFEATDIAYHDGKFAVCGKRGSITASPFPGLGGPTSSEGPKDVCFIFDETQKITSVFSVSIDNHETNLLNAAFQGEDLIVHGESIASSPAKGFIAKVSLAGNTTPTSVEGKLLTLANNQQMVANDSFIYLNNYATSSVTPAGSVLTKLSSDLDLLWTKNIEAGGEVSLNQVTTNSLTWHGDNGMLLSLDLEANSCKTSPYIQPVASTQVTLKLAPLEQYDRNTVTYIFSPTSLNVIDISSAAQVVEICQFASDDDLVLDGSTVFQSPYLHLNAAGSTGEDSTQGIHLRWLFRDVLGDTHLPKGEASTTSHHFNKPNDVVSLYRAPYQKSATTLSFTEVPTQIDDINATWVYRFANDRELHVYFQNVSKYNELRASNGLNSGQEVYHFVSNYGNNVIEIENKKEQFFAVEFTIEEDGNVARLLAETLSVEDNQPLTLKAVSARNAFTLGVDPILRLVCENGRSVRLQADNAIIEAIHFEFYNQFITNQTSANGWEKIGEYALTLDDATALERLEPSPGLVHKAWRRYNEDEFVNIENYQKKWNRSTEPWDRDIKQVVTQYLSLSENASNPTATEQVALGDGGNIEISNLDLLNLASYDYHIARMLGLGCLDTEASIMSYVYLISYTTLGDLQDGKGAREVQHLTMSLPTSINDQRLPLPVHVQEVVPGAFFGGQNNGQKLTDDQGYTQSGESRYVSVYAQDQPEDLIEVPFYQSSDEFSAADYTIPVYAGLEYGTANGQWVKPELAYDNAYRNVTNSGAGASFETRPLQLPENDQALFVHRQTVSGTHYYRGYGINLFSRSSLSNEVVAINTTIQPKNPLLPPSAVNALLIRDEKPLLLTSTSEQTRLEAIGNGNDQTLVRLTFDYHIFQDMITRQVPSSADLTNSELLDSQALYPDSKEIFSDKVELFFRHQMPSQITGKAISVEEHLSNELLSIVKVDDYYMASVGKTLSPVIIPGTESNYIGGTFALGKQQHLIQSVTIDAGKPVFTIYKKEISDALVNDLPSANADNLQAIDITDDGLFMVVENMQNEHSWGNNNPLSLEVAIGETSWGIHREVIETPESDGSITRQLEKTRGIWSQNATVAKELEEVAQVDANNNPVFDGNGQVVTTLQHQGLYKITLTGQQLAKHAQYNENGVSVEWFRGIARVFTQGSIGAGTPLKTRKNLKVLRIENIDTANDLVIYVQDDSFSSDAGYDAIQEGNDISVNFYPGYKVYLYADATRQLDEAHVLPSSGEGTRYSIFGLRSVHTGTPEYQSKISVPSPMFAQEQVAAEIPEKPLGALYATRPDFFGRSTYTFTTQYVHKPHGVLFYRANDEVLLHAIYEKTTVQQIRADLEVLGGKDETYAVNRWQNFLNFEELAADGDYKNLEDYSFPNPDKKSLFEWARDVSNNLGVAFIPEQDWGTVAVGDPRLINFVKGALYNVFVPLTRVPVVYQHIKGSNYEPVNKKQVIRDKNGYVLTPNHPDFDLAPMMKVVGTTPHKTQFTDFNLDGTSNNLYFYGVKEVDTQMKMGDFSPFLGPIKLVNTNPPEAPEVKRIIPKLENVVLGTPPSIQVEVNAYPAVQNIRKLNIYRAFSKLEAQSVRTMQLVDTVDLEQNGVLSESTWQIEDTFADLAEIPYGEGLFYRVTTARKIEYAKKGNANDVVVEYAPSQASKILGTLMVEVNNPPTPSLTYTAGEVNAQSELPEVVLSWEKTCYKGKYHLYKMNAKGNWVKVYEFANSDNHLTIQVPLQNTEVGTDRLLVRDENNALIYHHFKVVAENTSGLLSTQEQILTVYSTQNPPAYSLSFNGADAYLGSQPGFVQWGKSQAFTMQFFVKDLAYTSGGGIIHNPLFSSLPNGSGGGFSLGFRRDDFIVSMQHTSSAFNSRFFSRGIPLADITHVALTYDGSGQADGFTLYLNGVAQNILQTHNKLGAQDAAQSTQFTLGRGYSWVGGLNYAKGVMKNFSVVDYQKNEAEVLADINAGAQAAGSGAYLLAYDFNIDVGAQSSTIEGLFGSPSLDISGATFLLD